MVFKPRESLPSDHGLFCLVVAHLLKNAHRYFNMESQSEFQCNVLEEKSVSESTRRNLLESFHKANKQIREIGDLKCKNRVSEQQKLVGELRDSFKSYRKLSVVSGIPLKTVHNWCSLPKVKVHKSKLLSQQRRSEFQQFLLQDSISYAHPSKKFAGKRFLRYTMEEIRKMYLQNPDFHTHSIISMSSMKAYSPSNILLCGQTPLDQCLCDRCENCEQLLKTLLSLSVKQIPVNRLIP